MKNFSDKLKNTVKNHDILRHPWLLEKKENIQLSDMVLWLQQEYHVSVAFVNWFLYTAAKTDNQKAKIVLVRNIWEELGEGNPEETHVSILNGFLNELGFPEDRRILLSETRQYLEKMKEIVQISFYHGLGALGPANEYLLKLEYTIMSQLYKKLQDRHNLPIAKFFQINLNADEGHAQKMFELIEEVSTNVSERIKVEEGNEMALEARNLFYDGLVHFQIQE